ncbi:BTB/POZ protein [Podospora fimiseda]|uniref:BTB/POZ protein n=1 Tax=Podospora fimiseda TaxID=252190 RepID=A0AAN7BF49_9PEZI|nr:BTB/POZ protein [Podospora fimiseda]
MEQGRFLSSDEKLFESGLFSDVTIKCGDREWKLHKNILCTRSTWFERALNGTYVEATTGIVNIQDFDPEAVNWVLRYLYSGKCDIRQLKPESEAETTFVTCYEVYKVADFFLIEGLVKIAMDTLDAEFSAKLPALQLAYDTVTNWLPEFFDAVRLVYADCYPGDTKMSPIRHAFVQFAHTARFFFLQNEEFNKFTDTEAPVFALDLFRTMRETGDFVMPKPDCCMSCMFQFSKGRYYSHLAPEMAKLNACCQSCAIKRGYGSSMEDWSKKAYKMSLVPKD